MSQDYRKYKSYVPAVADGELVERPVRPSAIVPMHQGEITQGGQQRQLRQSEKISGTPVDRAHAFRVRTQSISLATGAATAAIWFLVRWALPMTAGASTAGVLVVGAVAIISGLLAFFIVWTSAYLVDMLTSPGGVDLLESWRTQRRIDKQSDAMVEAFRRQNGIEK